MASGAQVDNIGDFHFGRIKYPLRIAVVFATRSMAGLASVAEPVAALRVVEVCEVTGVTLRNAVGVTCGADIGADFVGIRADILIHVGGRSGGFLAATRACSQKDKQ